ncbi:MAG: hypothetical protein AUI36_18770 [Cyanobacteria bacterium 13_1_40CM_2_61_4]|nr:MAG: hypothetical protein AUI36_18770 [Cyanobacteria bacterium 13_1_40CM_2_61_4]
MTGGTLPHVLEWPGRGRKRQRALKNSNSGWIRDIPRSVRSRNTLTALRCNGARQQQFVLTGPDFIPAIPSIPYLVGFPRGSYIS